MSMGSKFSLLLTGGVSGSLKSAFSSVAASSAKLKQQLDSVNQVSQKISSFKKLNEQLDSLRTRMDGGGKQGRRFQEQLRDLAAEARKVNEEYQKQTARLEKLKTTIAAGGGELKEVRADYKKTTSAVKKLGTQYEKLTARQTELQTRFGRYRSNAAGKFSETSGKLREMSSELKRAGVNMNNLAASEKRLAAQTARTNRQLAHMGKAAHFRDMRQSAFDGFGGMAASAVTVAVPAKLAIDFEEQMAEVKKVVDFETPEQFQQMGKDILKLSTIIPMSAKGFADITAAAGQSGVARKELLQFATDAAKMGVAFDIAGGKAGKIMAAWRAGLSEEGMGLSQERVVALADAVNYLSNKMNATAPDLAEVVRRMGAVGMSAGLTEVQVASLGAAFLAAGASPEVAGTAFKNFTNALTKGEAMTRSQRTALGRIGFGNPDRLARDMQTNAAATMTKVIEALAKAPKHKQGALAGMLFGEESKGAIMPLLNNLKLLKQALELTADKTKYLGSMQKEFEERSKTTANALELLKNKFMRLGIIVGTYFLPAINTGAKTIGNFIDKISGLVEKYPKLSGAVIGASMGLLGGAAALSALGMAGKFVAGGLGQAYHLFRAFTVALAANPFTVVIAGVGLLVAALWKLGYLQKFINGFTVAFDNWGHEIKGIVLPAVEALKKAFAPLRDFFQNKPDSSQLEFWKNLGIQFGKLARIKLTELITSITGLTIKLIEFGQAHPRLMAGIAGAIPALIAGSAAFKVLAATVRLPLVGLGKTIGLIKKLGALLMLNPFGLFLAGIAGLGLALHELGVLKPLITGLGQGLKTAWGPIKESIRPGLEALRAILSPLGDAFKNLAASIGLQDWKSFGRTIGGLVAKGLIALAQGLSNLLKKFASFQETHPKLTAGLAGFTSALLAAPLAIKALSVAINPLLSGLGGFLGLFKRIGLFMLSNPFGLAAAGVLLLVGALHKLGALEPMIEAFKTRLGPLKTMFDDIAQGWTKLLGPGQAVQGPAAATEWAKVGIHPGGKQSKAKPPQDTGALAGRFAGSFLADRVTDFVAFGQALGHGAAEIVTYWENAGRKVSDVFQGIGQLAGNIVKSFGDVWQELKTLYSNFDLKGLIQDSLNAAIAKTEEFCQSFKNKTQDILNTFKGVWEDIKAFLSSLSLYDLGAKIMNSLADGVRSVGNKVKGVISDTIGYWGQTLGLSKGPAEKNPIAGKRASGGPVDAGKTYLVGEKGPELFVPNFSGRIVPNLTRVATGRDYPGLPQASYPVPGNYPDGNKTPGFSTPNFSDRIAPNPARVTVALDFPELPRLFHPIPSPRPDVDKTPELSIPNFLGRIGRNLARMATGLDFPELPRMSFPIPRPVGGPGGPPRPPALGRLGRPAGGSGRITDEDISALIESFQSRSARQSGQDRQIIINYSPTINIPAGTKNAEEIERAVSKSLLENKEQLRRMIAEIERDERRLSFA